MLSSAPKYEPPVGGSIDVGTLSGMDQARTYVVEIVDRSYNQSQTVRFGTLPFSQLTWSRVRNDFSTSSITVPKGRFNNMLIVGGVQPWKHAVRIIRNGVLVWGGPVTAAEDHGDNYTIQATDWTTNARRKQLPYDLIIEPGGTKIVDTGGGVFSAQPWYSEQMQPHFDALIDAAWELDAPELRPPKPFYGIQHQVLTGESVSWRVSDLRSIFDHFSDSGYMRRWTADGVAFYSSTVESAFNVAGKTASDRTVAKISFDSFKRDSVRWRVDGIDQYNEWFRLSPENGDQVYDGPIETYSWADIGEPNPGTAAGGGFGIMQRGVTEVNEWPEQLEGPQNAFGITAPKVTVTSAALSDGSPVGIPDLVPHRIFRLSPPTDSLLGVDGSEEVLLALTSVDASVGISDGTPTEDITIGLGAPL